MGTCQASRDRWNDDEPAIQDGANLCVARSRRRGHAFRPTFVIFFWHRNGLDLNERSEWRTEVSLPHEARSAPSVVWFPPAARAVRFKANKHSFRHPRMSTNRARTQPWCFSSWLLPRHANIVKLLGRVVWFTTLQKSEFHTLIF